MRKEIEILRNMIDGELNRIAVSNDKNEIEEMYRFLQDNIYEYYCINKIDRLDKESAKKN